MQNPIVIVRTFLASELIARLELSYRVINMTKEQDWQQVVADRYTQAYAVITNGHDGASRSLIEALPALRIVACNGVGYDAVDVQAAIEHNVVVTHTPNVLNNDVANTTIMLLLAISRRLVRDVNWIKEGSWVTKGGAPLTDSIEGKHVGIVGMGRIGQEIAHKLSVFNCKISYHSRTQKPHLPYPYVDCLLTLAQQVDYLIVMTVGDASTYQLINREVINALGKKGTLINMARGSVVDQDALIDALLDGTLGAAALDVFEDEPNTPSELYDLDNVIMLPHVGSATKETRFAMGALTVDNVLNMIDNQKPSTPIPECAGINT